ncbi:MAG: hypothetical protein JOY62_19480 [Acidobacteriaceae bacterium]|nr:hypothetical protein [Acidobacteriaceae bacterium]MBV9782149.1 hypothetical protein [Acidobacteriaceae bacterium]
MSRRGGLILLSFLLSASLSADDSALWHEYGLVASEITHRDKLTVTTYQMKDQTGALAAWQWLRSAKARSCDLASFCTEDTDRTVVFDDNYVFVFGRGKPNKSDLDAVFARLPNRRDSSLPAILTFLPREGRIANSARYVLGPASLNAFAPELTAAHPGFEQGAEAEVASYKVGQSPSPVRFAIFYYPTPEMARLHFPGLQSIAGVRAKRSGVLIAAVFGPATDAQAQTLLSRVEYEAKITWNEVPSPGPIKPLFQLLINILYLSAILSGLCLTAGIIYGGMRLYRRRYGTLEADESMITLNLTGS